MRVVDELQARNTEMGPDANMSGQRELSPGSSFSDSPITIPIWTFQTAFRLALLLAWSN